MNIHIILIIWELILEVFCHIVRRFFRVPVLDCLENLQMALIEIHAVRLADLIRHQIHDARINQADQLVSRKVHHPEMEQVIVILARLQIGSARNRIESISA